MTYVEIRFTIDDPGAAMRIVDSLLAEHLVACGQRVGPILSRYRWAGAVEESEEWLVLLKTRADLADRVIEVVVGRHPYQTPEVVAVPVVAGHAGYLRWIDDVTDTTEPPGATG